MRKKVEWTLVAGSVIVGGILFAGGARATPGSGFSATTLATGRFGDIDASNHASRPEGTREEEERAIWLSFQKTKGASDLYVQDNVWAPGGSTGWHTHPGHSLILVTEGEVTAYDGEDPACTPRVYTAGMGFVDPGGRHVHLLRNETSSTARTIAVQLIPSGATRRVDAAKNPACPF